MRATARPPRHRRDERETNPAQDGEARQIPSAVPSRLTAWAYNNRMSRTYASLACAFMNCRRLPLSPLDLASGREGCQLTAQRLASGGATKTPRPWTE